MRLKSMVIAAIALLASVVPTAASAQKTGVPDNVAVVGSIHGRGVAGPGSYATLIDVHELAKGKARAKPRGTANCSNAGAESGTYALTGWKIGGNRTAHLNTATVPAALGSVTSVLEASWDVWSAAEPAAPSINVATDGTVTRYTANRNYDILWGSTGGSLATTYTWRWNDGAVESDVVFNKGYTWWNAPSEGDGCYETAGTVYDVGNIATHEFGHAYGLDHPSGARFETMYAYGYSGETLKRSLGSGDVAGVRANY